MNLKYRLWQWLHNCVFHPLEGFTVLLLGYYPNWCDRLHEWSALKMYDVDEKNNP